MLIINSSGSTDIPMVSWNLIQKPKKTCGLGVGDLVIKNVTYFLNGGGDFQRKNAYYGRE